MARRITARPDDRHNPARLETAVLHVAPAANQGLGNVDLRV